jgi:hypothetical protein
MDELRTQLDSGPIEVARDMGITDERLVRAMARLHLAAMRGLAIERLLQPDLPTIEDAFGLLRWYKSQLQQHLLDGTSDQITSSLD